METVNDIPTPNTGPTYPRNRTAFQAELELGLRDIWGIYPYRTLEEAEAENITCQLVFPFWKDTRIDNKA